MHKKPIVAVMLFGLLLITSLGVAEARVDPGGTLEMQGQMLPMIARGLVKGTADAPQPIPGSPTTISVGTARSGATFCDGQWQGGNAFFIGTWLVGDEFYAAYQDPEELGGCAPLDDLYTFDVTAVNWSVVNQGFPGPFNIQPLVYDNGGDEICPVPGNVTCAGPVYSVGFPGGGTFNLSLPFPTECCQFGPYFAGVYFADFVGPSVIDIVIDNGVTVAPVDCYTYNEYGFGWVDLNADAGFGANLMLSSEGLAFDQNNCPGLPGACDFQSWWAEDYWYWTTPDGNLTDDRFVRYTADVSCTLMEFSFSPLAFGEVGTPTYRVTVWGPNGPISGGRMYPQADLGGPLDVLDPNLIVAIDIPHASLTHNPGFTAVDLTSYNIEFGPGQDVIVCVGLSPNTPDPINDVIALLSDFGDTPTGRSGAYFGVIPGWRYLDQVFGSDYDWVYSAYICCEVVDAEEVACTTPGPDDWSTFAHDYQRTSATSIEVGDPCQINPVWTADLPQNVNFTQATAANDRVYITSDLRAAAYNLTTGALTGSVSGIPHLFAAGRSNMTVEGGSVYLTGGTGQSLGQWNTDLTVNNWVNGFGNGIGALGANTRFGAAVAIPGLDIVVVGTEAAGAGKLYAFNTLDGTLFGGWATNPLVLNEAIWHGAAFDGTDLFVGTASNALANGELYSIDAASGAINWQSAYNGDGFPAGVSIDGDFLYVSSSGLGTSDGKRYKLNKSDGTVVWEFNQQRSLYGTPAIGRNFVYINQDGSGLGGLYAIDKNTGAPVYNFAADGVGRITQHVTITCDNYAFAGDRNAKWWLLDLLNFTPVWSIEMPYGSPVMGTAVTSNVAGDRDFAILTAQFAGPTAGLIAAYEFNSGARPLINQLVTETNIGVEFGTGAGNLYTEVGVFSNAGCAEATFIGTTILDPLPDPVSSRFSAVQSRHAAAVANRMVDGNYNTYIDAKTNKAQRLLIEQVDVENTRYDMLRQEARQSGTENVRTRGSNLAAGANALVRTSGVLVTTRFRRVRRQTFTWTFDGTGLARGVDVEVLVFDTDDPDRIFLDNQPVYQITYAGGCFPAFGTLEWNTGGAAHTSRIYNDGQMGDDTDAGEDFDFMGLGRQDIYSACFYLAGEIDNVAVPPISQFHTGDINSNFSLFPEFLPDPFPGPSCDFQGASDVPMGFKREGGCPGTPTEILGEWIRTAYVDTNLQRVGTFGEAIGTRLELTEVGAYDPLYGNFKLQRWEVQNRDNVDKGPIYAGTWMDWDVAPDFSANTGFFSLAYNGYGLYDADSPDWCMGIFDPNLPTAYGGVDATANRPQRINPMGERPTGGTGAPEGNYDGPWQSPDADYWEEMWTYAIDRLPQFEDGPQNLDDASANEDHAGLITMKGQLLPANGTIAFHQALYAVDATSGDELTMEANGLALAQLASKWAGFARGDVNDDNTVNLLDVCWLLSGHQIYPADYNGDVNLDTVVDAADEAYLLDYVTGLGAAPLGDWRFTF